MSILSKLQSSLNFTTVNHSCHQLTHPWNPSCVGAVVDILPFAFKNSFRTYVTFYGLTCVVKLLRGRKVNKRQTIKDILRSTVFLATNFLAFVYASCLLRKLFGCYFWGSYYVSAAIGSFLAIIQESKHRRPALALYLTNLASESLFYQLENRHYISKAPNGLTLLFSTALGIFFHYKAKGVKTDMDGILNLTHSLKKHNTKDASSKIEKMPKFIKDLVCKIRNCPKGYDKCIHQYSCVSNVLETSMTNFGYGMTITVLLATFKNMNKPLKAFKKLINVKSLALPTFTALMPGIYHTINCLLNNYTSLSKSISMPTAGAASGAAMLIWPNLTISTYFLWKAFEVIYHRAADKGYVPRFKNGDILLYSIVTGYIVGNCIVEPHALRPSYYFKFIRGLSNNYSNALPEPS